MAAAQRPAMRLYRAMLRAAAKLPTKNRRLMAEDKIRAEFRKCAAVTDVEALHELFLIGHTHLDTIGSAPPAAIAPDAVNVRACARMLALGGLCACVHDKYVQLYITRALAPLFTRLPRRPTSLSCGVLAPREGIHWRSDGF